MQARAADRREAGSRRRKTSRLLRAVVLLGGAVLAGTGKSNAADKHPFGIDDYSALHSARAVAVSPDGKTILYNVSTDGTKGATKHEWRLIDVNGENSHKLELPEKFEPRGFTPVGANPRGSNFSGSSSLCEFSPFTSIRRHSCLVAPFVPSVLTLYRMVLPSGETATARALCSAE